MDTPQHAIISPEAVTSAEWNIDIVEGKKKVFVNGKGCGLSESKWKYIRSLAEHFVDPDKLYNVDFNSISDEDLYSKLIAVKGIGAWSVHCFMIFHLHRPNVLPTGDLAVRRGVCKLYGLPLNTYEGGGKKGEGEMLKRCAHWAPYSTLASLYMWKIAKL